MRSAPAHHGRTQLVDAFFIGANELQLDSVLVAFRALFVEVSHDVFKQLTLVPRHGVPKLNRLGRRPYGRSKDKETHSKQTHILAFHSTHRDPTHKLLLRRDKNK